MKLVSFVKNGAAAGEPPRLGVLADDASIVDVASDPQLPSTMVALFALPGLLPAIQRKLAALPRLRRAEVRLCAPVPHPAKNVICVGKNYRAHAKEFQSSGFDGSSGGETIPEYPAVFTKPSTTIIAGGEPIPASADETNSVDYEGELVVVIGKGGRAIPRERALDHVFGYTLANDVTSRITQARHKQWFLGKSADGFCPIGPAIVTADEVPDPARLRLRTTVNGEVRQDASAADLIFDIPYLIACISKIMTLDAGDLIATGTPEGVGIGFKPPRYLRTGDVVEITVEEIGTLSNPVN
ncbi:MAG TPA: fumarylacetoacetate hydrolase family protein [Bradyrhizobium sp.]